MGDSIKCPACCNNYFSSKSDLIEHLAPFLGDIECPVCKNKWSSMGHLLEHLSLDDCTPDGTYKMEQYKLEEAQPDDSPSGDELGPKLDLQNNGYTTHDNVTEYISNTKEIGPVDLEDSKMYVEFLNKQLLQTQEVKLIKDNGISRYVFVMNEDPSVDSDSTIVTKQNHDGTISLTTVKEVPEETDTLITQDTEPENSYQEIYSCNTCGVSFTSVVDHIQTYHNDQDVVVEEPVDDSETSVMDTNTAENEVSNNQGSRRMITDTGDIVETPTYNFKTKSITLDEFHSINTIADSTSGPMFFTLQEMKEEDRTVSKGKAAQQTVLNKQVDHDDFAVIKKIKEPDDVGKGGKYHKVILKEVTNSANEKIRLFKCISCHAHVSNLEDFKNKPCKIVKYQCTQCSVTYNNAKSLCAHMRIHKKDVIIGTNGITYGCEICKTVFTTNKSLKLHKRMHDPVKERPIDPPVETPEGGTVSSDKFLCVVCQKLIPIDYKVIHLNSHKNFERFNCDICNKKFTSREYLDMHINVHNVDKVSVARQDEDLPYKCVYCERRFTRPHEKVKHERIHTGEKPHSCEICGKSFRVSYCLTLHMRTHTGARPYTCPHCGKRFKAHSVFNHHLLTHSDERNYKCPYCPKAFKTSVQLAGHKNSHTKPFACQYCNRPFASLYAVRVHTETHSRQNNLKFSCAICGASYARAFALKDHVKQAHEDEIQIQEDGVRTYRTSKTNTKEYVVKEDDSKDSQNNSEDDENIIMGIINTNDLVVQ